MVDDDGAAIDRDVARLGKEIVNQRIQYLLRAHEDGEPLALLELIATAHRHGKALPRAVQRAVGKATTEFLEQPGRDLAVLLGAGVKGRGKTDPRMARAERLRDDAFYDALELLRRKRDPLTGREFTMGRAAALVARAAGSREWLPGATPSTLETRTILDRVPKWSRRARVHSKEGRDIYVHAMQLAEKRARVKKPS